MAIDPQGQLRLAYANVNAMTAGVRMATWNGKEWRLEVVDDLASNQHRIVGYSLAMTLDKTGTPHLSYWDVNVPLVKYATLNNGHWVTEVVDYLKTFASNDRNSIAIDEAGRPYMGYYDAGYGQLRLAHKEGAKWKIEVVDGGFVGFTNSLQIDRGVIWITYADETNQQLKVARRPLGAPNIDSREGKAAANRQNYATGPEQLPRAKQN
jgi:hypothetical protein